MDYLNSVRLEGALYVSVIMLNVATPTCIQPGSTTIHDIPNLGIRTFHMQAEFGMISKEMESRHDHSRSLVKLRITETSSVVEETAGLHGYFVNNTPLDEGNIPRSIFGKTSRKARPRTVANRSHSR